MRPCSVASCRLDRSHAGCLQALRQRHLQQIAAGMGGKPGLQVGVDAVDQPDPGAAMHVAPVLGRDDVAGDFRLDAVAREQQIERRRSSNPAKPTAKPRARCSAAVRSRWNSGTSVPSPVSAGMQRCAQPRRARRGAGVGASAAASPASAATRRSAARGRAIQAAAQPLDRQFDGVALQHRRAGARPGQAACRPISAMRAAHVARARPDATNASSRTRIASVGGGMSACHDRIRAGVHAHG